MTTKQFLDESNEVKELATELFGGVWEDAVMWMQTPSSLFFDKTPMQIIASGDGKILIDWLMIRTGKKPGAAF